MRCPCRALPSPALPVPWVARAVPDPPSPVPGPRWGSVAHRRGCVCRVVHSPGRAAALRHRTQAADQAGNRRPAVGGTMRRAGIVVVIVLALTAVGTLVSPASAAMPATPGRIDGLRGRPGRSWSTAGVAGHPGGGPDLPAGATGGDRWRLARGPMPGRVGYNGFSANRHEGDGTTPAGTFGFVYGFGSQPNPGMHGFSYRRLQPNSCWSGSRAAASSCTSRPAARPRAASRSIPRTWWPGCAGYVPALASPWARRAGSTSTEPLSPWRRRRRGRSGAGRPGRPGRPAASPWRWPGRTSRPGRPRGTPAGVRTGAATPC
jgi:hypothetical protein